MQMGKKSTLLELLLNFYKPFDNKCYKLKSVLFPVITVFEVIKYCTRTKA